MHGNCRRPEMNMLNRDELKIGESYEDVNGKQVTLTSIDQDNVQWASLDGPESGNVNIDNFMKNYHPLRRAA
jgi:hypothetical protein